MGGSLQRRASTSGKVHINTTSPSPTQSTPLLLIPPHPRPLGMRVTGNDEERGRWMGDESHTAVGTQPCPIAYRNLGITLLVSLFWEEGNGLWGAKGCKTRGLWLRERDGKYRRAPAGQSCCSMTRIHTVRTALARSWLVRLSPPCSMDDSTKRKVKTNTR